MGAIVPFDVATINSEDAVRGVVEAMARYISTLLSTRCSLSIRRRGVNNSLSTPFTDLKGGGCVSCGRDVDRSSRSNSVLCALCKRRCPEATLGPRLISTMYDSSNPAYALTPEVEFKINSLNAAYEEMLECIKLSEELENIARYVLLHAPRNEIVNVPIPRDVVKDWRSYAETIHLESEFVYSAGGLGIALRDEIERRVKSWLLDIDRKLCAVYKLSSTQADPALVDHMLSVFDCLSFAIANRVSMMEPEEGEPTDFLSVAMCEELNRMQMQRTDTEARAIHRRDLEALNDLYSLSNFGTHEETHRQIITDKRRRNRLSKMVSNPPPEFNQQLLSMDVLQMNFGLLQRALSHPGLEDHVRMSVVEKWRDEDFVRQIVATAAAKAIELARKWTFSSRSGYVCVVRRLAQGTVPVDAQLLVPPVTWSKPASRWVFYSLSHQKRLRLGLDEIGMRTSMVVSVVWSFLGFADPPEFAPGCIEAKLVRDCACVEAQRASACLIGLRSELRPMAISSEFLAAKKVLTSMAPQVEDDLRSAACAISHCSEVEIVTVCHPNGPFYHKTESMLSSSIRTLLPSGLAPSAYRGFVRTALELALPLIRTQRVQRGVDVPFFRCHPIGDLLRCVPLVRSWDWRKSGDLVLSPRALINHPQLRASLDTLAKHRLVVRVQKRQYVFCTADVIQLLGSFF